MPLGTLAFIKPFYTVFMQATCRAKTQPTTYRIDPAHHPLCIELIDAEERLRKFLHEHAEELRHVQAVLFRCELAI